MGETYTEANVARMTLGLVSWLKARTETPKVVLGHDCRRKGKEYMEVTAAVLLRHGVEVLMPEGFVSTPMVSLAARDMECDCGVVITASHNPPAYNGYKLKSHHGGPMQGDDLDAVEAAIPDHCPYSADELALTAEERSRIIMVDLESHYVQAIERTFDLDAIRSKSAGLAYDPMFGAGRGVMRRLFPEITFHHSEDDPDFGGISPEPILRNLAPFSQLMASDPQLLCGLATDGDADRIGLFDGEGRFVDAHHIILLLIHYLHRYKGECGKVVTGFSSVTRIAAMCTEYDLPLEVVKIGFKYASSIMVSEPVMLGGEESGGIAVQSHIPERDGIWMGLIIWEFMAKTGKSLSQLIQEVYEVVGAFVFERNDLHLTEEKKQAVVAKCHAGEIRDFDGIEVLRVEDLDGWKYFITEDSWIMIRPSGTEPVLRVYVEAPTQERVDTLVAAAKAEIASI